MNTLALLDDRDAGRISVNSDAQFFDFSDEFPKGFGHVVYGYGAHGGGGPGVSAESLKAATSGHKPPAQIDPSELKEILGRGAN
jgi:hypothetical protein